MALATRGGGMKEKIGDLFFTSGRRLSGHVTAIVNRDSNPIDPTAHLPVPIGERVRKVSPVGDKRILLEIKCRDGEL